MSKNITEQEQFWAGQFGSDYTKRNAGAQWVASNLVLFSQILRNTRGVKSVIEFGSNSGLNLKAIQSLLPDAGLAAVEINGDAVAELRAWAGDQIQVFNNSILEFASGDVWDLVLIKGVLIHINPSDLPHVYNALVKASSKYVCIVEYYNPSPVEVPYRGFSERMFKRDFAGEILDQHPALSLVDYGFVYHRDNSFPQDDITYFLLERKHAAIP